MVPVEQIDTSDSHGQRAHRDALAGRCWVCGREGREVKVTRTRIEGEAPGYWVSCKNGCKST